MCGHAVMDTVRRTMLDRRALLVAGAAAPVVAGLPRPGLAAPPEDAPDGPPAIAGTPVDLTHTLTAGFPTFSGVPQFAAEQRFSRADDGYNLFVLTVDEHTGTHVDAPLHFSAHGPSVDEIPLADLIAPLVVIDIAAKAEADADAGLTPDDLTAWIARHGDLPPRCCVAMHSGWERHLGTDRFRNADADGTMHFPGVHSETAQMLIEETTAVGLAVDTLSLDHGVSSDFATHNLWLPSNRWGLECVAALSGLPPRGATIVVGAPKHRGGSGGPARVFALV